MKKLLGFLLACFALQAQVIPFTPMTTGTVASVWRSAIGLDVATPGAMGTQLVATATADSAVRTVLGIETVTKRPVGTTNFATPMPFRFPTTTAPWIIPCNATVGWTTYNSTLTTNSSLGGFGQSGTNVFLVWTKGTSDIESYAHYALGATYDLTDYHILVGYRVPAGTVATNLPNQVELWAGNSSNYQRYSIGVNGTDWTLDTDLTDNATVWNAVCAPAQDYIGGTGGCTAATRISLMMQTKSPDRNEKRPVIHILYIALVPKPVMKAQLVVITDTVDPIYALPLARACAANGIWLTIGQHGDGYSDEIKREFQALGHAVSIRGANWSDYATPELLLASTDPVQQNIINGGVTLQEGYRWISVGNNNRLDDRWWRAMVPKYFYGISQIQQPDVQSPYQIQNIRRCLDYTAGTHASFMSIIDKAVTCGGRVTICLHNVSTGSPVFVSTAIPALTPYLQAGKLESLTMPQAYDRWKNMNTQRTSADINGVIVAAAGGTNAATATVVLKPSNIVTGGATTNGVVLWSGVCKGEAVEVFNSSAEPLLVFPHSGGNINEGTTDASISMTAHTRAIFRRVGRLIWAGTYE